MIEAPEDPRLVDLSTQDLLRAVRAVVRDALADGGVGAPERLMTTDELAEDLRISADTVRSWAHRGCPCLRISKKKLRWRQKDVLRWLEGRSNG
jgi:hypothetical protein